MTDTSTTPNTYSIDPAPLNFGKWCRRAENQLGEGDFPRRTHRDGTATQETFLLEKLALWVSREFGRGSAEVHRSTPRENFSGTQSSYR